MHALGNVADPRPEGVRQRGDRERLHGQELGGQRLRRLDWCHASGAQPRQVFDYGIHAAPRLLGRHRAGDIPARARPTRRTNQRRRRSVPEVDGQPGTQRAGLQLVGRLTPGRSASAKTISRCTPAGH